jgi:hypothetical protein
MFEPPDKGDDVRRSDLVRPDSSLEPLRFRATLLRASLELHIGRPADALAMLRPILPSALEARLRNGLS